MKTESRLLKKTTRHTLVAAVFLFCISILSGCITHKVLDLRKERETRVKEAVNFWSLAAVRSAHVVAGGNAFACVEFRDSPGDAPQAYTINLSQADRIGRTFADLMPAGYGRSEGAHGSEAQVDLAWRLYPLLEAQKGCVSAAGESPFPVSELKIETVQIRREDQARLPGMLQPTDGATTSGSSLFEVRFFEHGSSEAGDVVLVYLPTSKGPEQSQPIGVAGAFEPGSEWVNPYTLLVAPAVAADTAIITTVALLWICAHGGCR